MSWFEVGVWMEISRWAEERLAASRRQANFNQPAAEQPDQQQEPTLRLGPALRDAHDRLPLIADLKDDANDKISFFVQKAELYGSLTSDLHNKTPALCRAGVSEEIERERSGSPRAFASACERDPADEQSRRGPRAGFRYGHDSLSTEDYAWRYCA
jgi:hypothetical protein